MSRKERAGVRAPDEHAPRRLSSTRTLRHMLPQLVVCNCSQVASRALHQTAKFSFYFDDESSCVCDEFEIMPMYDAQVDFKVRADYVDVPTPCAHIHMLFAGMPHPRVIRRVILCVAMARRITTFPRRRRWNIRSSLSKKSTYYNIILLKSPM